MGASAGKEINETAEERDEDLLLKCEEGESDKKGHLQRPEPGRVLLRGAFAGSVVTCDHILDTSLSLDYEVSAASLQPALEAFLHAAKAAEELRDQEKLKKEAERAKAIEEGKEFEEEPEAHGKGKGKERLEFVSSQSWQQLLTIMVGDSVDLDQIAVDDSQAQLILPYKAKLEEFKIDHDMLQKTHDSVKDERDRLLAENEAMRQELGKKSLDPDNPDALIRQCSHSSVSSIKHQKTMSRQTSHAITKEMEELQAHVAKLQEDLQLHRKSNVCSGDPSEWKQGSVTVHGAFVGTVKTDSCSLDTSLPVRGDLPLSLVLPTIQHLKWSSIVQQEIDELKAAKKEAERLESEAEGVESKEDDKEENTSKHGHYEEATTRPEVWDEIFKVLSSGIEDSQRYVLEDAARREGPQPASDVAKDDRAPCTDLSAQLLSEANIEAQNLADIRKAEMQELNRITEANNKTLEFVQAAELEVRRLKKEMEERFASVGAPRTAAIVQSSDKPESATPPNEDSAITYQSLEKCEAEKHGAIKENKPSVPKKRAYNLTSHVEDLEKWARELQTFSTKREG